MSTNHSSPFRARFGGRLAVLGSVLALVLLGTAAPAAASLQNVAVASQSGTLAAGTAGSVSFGVTVTRSAGTPNTNSIAVTGLPSGATGTFSAPSAWSPASGTGTRTYTLTVATTAAVAAGSYSFNVQASGTGPDPTGIGTLLVRGAQTITFGALPNRAVGDADFDPGATASSGLPVSYAASGPCVATGSSVHVTGVGTCTVTASQAGDAAYLAAPDVQQSFAIVKGAQTITFGTLPDRATVEPDFPVTATASSGLAVAFSASGACSMAGVSTVHLSGAVGSCTVTASQAGGTDYEPAADVVQTFDVVAPTHEIYAVAGNTTLAGLSVKVWGYSLTNAAVTRPGGPTLTATVGEPVALVLHNQLSEATSLVIRGQELPTDQTGASSAGGVGLYTFTPTEPGTYIYEAGPLANAQHQVAMGLYGVLKVNPASGPPSNDVVVVVSDIDNVLNNSANPATFDMRNFSTKYTLINGVVYPTANAVLGTVAPGGDVLVRYVNAGMNYHSMSVLGADQRIVADDGHPLTHPYTVVAQTVGPGQTVDAVVHASPTAAAGTMLTVFDANLQLRNRNRRPATATATVVYGGALGFLQISGTPSTGDTVGPLTTNVSASAGTVTADVSDVTTGGGDIAAAEFYIDSPTSTANPMTATDLAFDSPTEAVEAPLPTLPAGNHTVYVRGRDAAGNWGPLVSVAITNDNQAPNVTGVTLTKNPSNGSVGVALHATGSDTATGGSKISAAEYTIDGGSATAMTVSPAGAVTAGVDAVIPIGTLGALAEGAHVVEVRVQDSAGNVGSATISLKLDRTGPETSTVVAAPNPNNGTLGINTSTPAVRVTASVTDPVVGTVSSTIERAEGFIDTVGAAGTGFPFVPTDGSWSSSPESISVDIPLTTINSLSPGNHTVYVRAKDASGTWGPTSTTVLVIDKTPPTISSATLVPDTIAVGAANVTLNVSATDASGISSGQYWVDGTVSPPANPVPFPGASATITTASLAAGTHTVYVRVKDVAGNWSAVTSRPVYVVQAVNDARTFSANGSTTQTNDANASNGVITNDEPTGVAGRTARLASAPVRTSGNGSAVIVLSCPGSLGTAATPAISGNTVCTNGAYRVGFTGVTGNNNNQRAASKRGTFQFTYTLTLNGVTSTATVTITVN